MQSRPRFCLIFFLIPIVFSFQPRAMFMWYQTVQVPIDRVLTNLQTQLATDTNNVRTVYQLARIHSMAYSTNVQTVPIINTNIHQENTLTVAYFEPGGLQIPDFIQTNRIKTAQARAHLTNAIHYYQRAKLLVNWKDTNRWLILPIHLGHAWSLDQSGDREKAKEAYREALRYAWEIEVEGNYTIKERMQWAWNRALSGQNPLKGMKNYLGPGACYSQEIINYLLPLLDPKKDAKEIAKLKAAQKTLLAMPRAVTPILVSLQRDLSFDSLIDRSASVQFDLDGSGLPRKYQWITPNAAWLVYDHDDSGRITSGLQLFGNVTFWIFWQNGYDALAVLDDDRNGSLESAELRHLALWRDANSDGRSDPGEVRPLHDHGIVKLQTTATTNSSGILSHPAGALLHNGSSLPTYDWIAQSAPIPATP
jgi:hypothetical protein